MVICNFIFPFEIFNISENRLDPRLAFDEVGEKGSEGIQKLTVGVEYLNKLWKPDTFVSESIFYFY